MLEIIQIEWLFQKKTEFALQSIKCRNIEKRLNNKISHFMVTYGNLVIKGGSMATW